MDYNFVWSETGPLKPGAIFAASQSPSANLADENKITLTHHVVYDFMGQTKGPEAGV